MTLSAARERPFLSGQAVFGEHYAQRDNLA